MRFSLERLVLVRHGETAWNREGRLQGLTDHPLNEAGRLQSLAVAERLRGRDVDAVYTSPLLRAAQTAEAIAAALGRNAVRHDLLRERDVGAWGGLTYADLRDRHAGEWERALAGDDLPLGGGETKAQVLSRMAQAFAEIDRRHEGGRVVVVSHGMAIKALVCGLLGLDLAHSERIATPGNASLTEFEGRRGGPRLVVLADASHVDVLQSLSTNTTR